MFCLLLFFLFYDVIMVHLFQSSQASPLQCFWQLRNVITGHNEEWNQLYHRHTSKYLISTSEGHPFKRGFPSFLFFCQLSTFGWKCWLEQRTSFRCEETYGKVKQSVKGTACKRRSTGGDENKGDWSDIEIEMRYQEKPIKAIYLHTMYN